MTVASIFMIKTVFFALAAVVAAGTPLRATTWYVATNGNDAASGTSLAQPFATPFKAMSSVAASDTIYVRGGVYFMTNELKTSKAGNATNYCKLWAYAGEKPVFDFTNAPSGKRGIYISKDYWHVKGFEIVYARDNGVIIAGGNSNLVEGCVIHDSGDDGLTLGSTSVQTHGNLILNCDSYRNYGGGDGNNGDGYSAKAGCGIGNAFQGCRSWYNSDDGWDFYDNITNSVTLLNCWAFHNGTNLWGANPFNGNGNGFKLGGAGTHARHFLTNCVAFDNHKKGFDYNNGTGGHVMCNCTSFRNTAENFKFPVVPTDGTNTFINNISYAGGGVDLVAGSVTLSNSWQAFTVTPADFVSLGWVFPVPGRNADYTLPVNGLARLAPGSDLIDAGRDIGLPYRGVAPDLGAYESGGPPWFSVSPADLRWTNGTVMLRVNDVLVHGKLVILAATNLNVSAWESLVTNSPATNWLQFTDTAASRSRRFYRAEER
jgi:hypothetical protein